MQEKRQYSCPECGGPVVYDGGLYHCDDHGAWDRESLLVDGAEQRVED